MTPGLATTTTTVTPDGHLITRCAVCGSDKAPFGYGVNLVKGVIGKWYCRDHYPPFQPDAKRSNEPEKPAVATNPKPVNPKQGRLL